MTQMQRLRATVTQVNPLRIRIDGESSPLTTTPANYAGDLAVGDRVLVDYFDLQVTVLARHGGVGGTNPNILINGDFRVNQRGFTSGGSIYPSEWAADRWVFAGDGSTATAAFTGAVGSRTATLTRGNGTFVLARNRIEARDLPPGEYTVSWSGDMLGRALPVGGSAPAAETSPFTFTADGTSDYEIRFSTASATGTLANVKVERGAVATPFTPRPLGEELALCQRYYQRFQAGSTNDRFGLGSAFSTTGAHVLVPLLTRMRIGAPTLTFNDLRLADGVNVHAVSAMTLSSAGGSNAHQVQATSTGLTQFRPYDLLANSTASYVAFDAEL